MFGYDINTVKRFLLRAAALVLCAVFALSAMGCGKSGNNDNGDKSGERFGLNETQYANLTRLASAFRVFGEYDPSQGVTFEKMEYIVFCYFSAYIEESSPAGFGTVSAEEADAAIQRIFGKLTIMDVMRRKYDADGDQTYYFKNGSYKVMITDDSAFTYRITSLDKSGEDGEVTYKAVIDVLRDNSRQLQLNFELRPDGDDFYVKKCTVNMWY